MAKKQQTYVKGTVVGVSYPSINKSVEVDLLKLPADMQRQAALHGLKQKLGDAASGGDAAEKYAEASAIVQAMFAGQWERTATVDMTPLILEAVSRIKKIPLKKLEAAKLPEEKVKEWGSNPKVKAEIAQIRAERAAKAAVEADDIEVDL